MTYSVRLPSGKIYTCRPGWPLLSEALSQGITLPYSCSNGSCGACRARIVSGRTEAVAVSSWTPRGGEERSSILTCCHTATTDLELDVPELPAIPPSTVLPCKIDVMTPIGNDMLKVMLRMPPRASFTYLPGQYINVTNRDGIKRSYSIANYPSPDNKLELHIKSIEGGEMSRYWFHDAKPEDLLTLEGPLGTFFFQPPSSSTIIFIATGTGIAPIKSMLEGLDCDSGLCQGKDIHLFWGARRQSNLYWKPNFKNLTVTFHPALSRDETEKPGTGTYVQQRVVDQIANLEHCTVYACGSEKMIASSLIAFTERGLESANFHCEKFVDSKNQSGG